MKKSTYFNLKVVVLVLLAYCLSSATPLPIAKNLLENPPVNGNQLIEQVTELSDRIGEIQSYSQFRSYLPLISFYEKESNKFGLSSIYPDLVNNYADRLVGHGIRWIKLEVTPLEEIGTVLSYMSALTMNRFLDRVEGEVSFLGAKADVTKVGEALRLISEKVVARFPDNRALVAKSEQLGSTLSERVLTNEGELSEEEFKFWLSQLLAPNNIQNYLLYIYDLVLTTDSSKLSGLSRQFLITGVHLEEQKNLSRSITNIYGDGFIELVGKATDQGTYLDLDKFQKALKNLGVIFLQSLAFRLQNPLSMPSASYVDHYLKLISILGRELGARGLSSSAKDLLATTESRMAASIAVQASYEGTYQLTDQNGDAWTLTLARSTEDRLIANLGFRNGMFHVNFFEISYSIKNKTFLATEYEPDDDPYANPAARFEFDGKGNVSVEQFFAKNGKRYLKGIKTESYSDYFSNIKPDAKYIQGTYEGRVNLPSGKNMKVLLYIVNFENYSTGRLESMPNNLLEINLQSGTQGGLGFIYLTSGQSLKGKSWLQLRLKLEEPSQLVGEVIVGGRGMGTAQFKKVD